MRLVEQEADSGIGYNTSVYPLPFIIMRIWGDLGGLGLDIQAWLQYIYAQAGPVP